MTDEQINRKLGEWMGIEMPFTPLTVRASAEAVERRLWEEGEDVEFRSTPDTPTSHVLCRIGEGHRYEKLEVRKGFDPIAARRRALCMATVKWLESKGAVKS